MLDMKIEITYQGIEFEVTGQHIPYRPAAMYLANGDPGYPEEGGCIEDLSICIGGEDITELLKDDVVCEIEKQTMEILEENWK